MKQSYNIGDLSFKTKKACEEYTRQVINRLGCCKVSNGHSEYAFLCDLLKNHPGYDIKAGPGIDYFFIRPNITRPTTYQTMIRRIDGTETDFSWRYCCEFRVRPTSHHLNLAMRSAIREDIVNFRNKQTKMQCKLCNTEDANEYHIDHNMPPFRDLKSDFLRETKTPIPNIFDELNPISLTIFKKEDEKFEMEWKEYHNMHCNLQVLCSTCNMKKH